MDNMFEGCNKLINLDLSPFNTENVTNMAKMFDSCYNLKKINLKSFNNKNLKRMDFMFQGCLNLKEIDLSSFDEVFGIGVFFGVKAKIILNKNVKLRKPSFRLPRKLPSAAVFFNFFKIGSQTAFQWLSLSELFLHAILW